jgi:predicted nucleic acid-binding Zn ribbon protein
MYASAEYTQPLHKCPFCAESIQPQALKCKHCGEILDVDLRAQQAYQRIHSFSPPRRKWEPGIAAVLSFFIPGLGQIYKGNVVSGLLWMVATFIGYLLLIIPGLILHFFCILTAAMGDPYRD